MYSHIINGHYMFGNTFIQPEMNKYNKIAHHNLAPANRVIPPYPDMVNRPIQCPKGGGCYLGYQDGVTKIDTPYTEEGSKNTCSECTDCPFAPNGIIRDPAVTNIINIETSVVKTLKVTLYGLTPDKDKTTEMKTGNRYAVTYITEHGLITSVGYLELISDSIPDECTRYINTTNMAAASTAYIGMDCSTEGHSDKRKIYIATIRCIQELNDGEEPEIVETKTNAERLDEFLDNVENGDLVFCGECDNHNKPEDGGDIEIRDPDDDGDAVDDDLLLEVPL